MEVALNYLRNDDLGKAYVPSVAGGPVADRPGDYVCRMVPITNGREPGQTFSLDEQGFCLEKYSHRDLNFYNDDDLVQYYEPIVSKLVGSVTGARKVLVFDHTRRSSSEQLRREKKMREHASVVHNDYTGKSGRKRLNELFPNEARELEDRRFSIVNVWRSISGTVESFPLAMCNARSVSSSDIVSVARESKNRVGEIQLAKYNSAHQWVYFPDMTDDELLLFKTFDSSEDNIAHSTLHTAFEDPNSSDRACPRESIESRCFVFY